MAAFDEAQARAALTTMTEKLTKGPFVTLGIDPSANAIDVRHAFLTLTKRYHPAKFARMSSELQRQANEVFLGIRGAHDTIARSLPKPPKAKAPSAPPVPRQGTPALGLPSMEPSSTGRSTPPRGLTTPAGSNRGSAPIVPGANRAAPHAPGAPIVLNANRTQSTPIVARGTEPRPRASSNGETNEPSRPPAPSGARFADPKSDPPRPAATAANARTAATTRVGAAPPPLTGSGPRPLPKAPTPSFGVRVPPVTPPKPLVGKTQQLPLVAAPVTTPIFDENAELAAGQELLRRGEYRAARQTLQTLANRVPQSRHYRAMFSYAKAKENPTARLVDEAIAELERLIQAEPSQVMAKAALADLRRK